MFCERVCLRLKHRKELFRCVSPPTRSKIYSPAFTPERSGAKNSDRYEWAAIVDRSASAPEEEEVIVDSTKSATFW
jgi:hypothetical protein